MPQSIPPLNGLRLVRNLAQGLTPVRTEDAPHTSGAGARAGDQADVDSSLAHIKSLLAELDERTAALANASEPVDAAQARIDQIVASIDQLVNASGAGANGGAQYDISNVSPFVRNAVVRHANLQPGESLDVHVVVTQSAQQGGFFLSFGGVLDLSAADARFSFEIGGRLGSQALVFASGTTVANIVNTINAFTKDTGVEAVVSHTGVRIQSTEFGDDNFVSVRMLDHGGINEAVLYAGVYQLSAYGTTVAAPREHELFSDFVKLQDFGQDAAAVINGIEAEADGIQLHVREPHLNLSFALQTDFGHDLPNPHPLGDFIAFTITAQEQSPGDALAQQIRSGLRV